jgi:hypothetical protein
VFACLANDYKEEEIIFVPIHPGRVDTDMNIGENPMPVSESSKGILEVYIFLLLLYLFYIYFIFIFYLFFLFYISSRAQTLVLGHS